MDIEGDVTDLFDRGPTWCWKNWQGGYISQNEERRFRLVDEIDNLSKKLAINLVEESNRIANHLKGSSSCDEFQILKTLSELLERHNKNNNDLSGLASQLDDLLKVDWTSPKSCLLQAKTLSLFTGIIDRASSFEDVVAFQEMLRNSLKIGDLIDLDEKVVTNFDEAIWWTCKKWSIIFLVKLFLLLNGPVKDRVKRKKSNDLTDITIIPILKTIKGVLMQERCPTDTEMLAKISVEIILYSVAPQRFKDELRLDIVKNVIFPLMCHTRGDKELYKNNPASYCRLAFVYHEGLNLPIPFSELIQNPLREFCLTQDRRLIEQSVTYALEILDKPGDDNPREKESSIHIIGSLSRLLRELPGHESFEPKIWKTINTYIINQDAFLRARTCWLVSQILYSHLFDSTKSENIDYSSFFDSIQSSETELCVKINILLLFKHLTDSKEVDFDADKYLKSVIFEFLAMIRMSKGRNVILCTNSLIQNYSKQLKGSITEIGCHLSATYDQISQDAYLMEDEKVLILSELLKTFGLLFDSCEGSA